MFFLGEWEGLYGEFQERFVNPTSKIDEELKEIRVQSERNRFVMSFVKEEIEKCITEELTPKSNGVHSRLEVAYREGSGLCSIMENPSIPEGDKNNLDAEREFGRLTWGPSNDLDVFFATLDGNTYYFNPDFVFPSIIDYLRGSKKSKVAERMMVTALVQAEVSAYFFGRFNRSKRPLTAISRIWTEFRMFRPNKLGDSMLVVHRMLHTYMPVNLRHFRERLSRSEDLGTLWPEAIYFLLDEMERREESSF